MLAAVKIKAVGLDYLILTTRTLLTNKQLTKMFLLYDVSTSLKITVFATAK